MRADFFYSPLNPSPSRVTLAGRAAYDESGRIAAAGKKGERKETLCSVGRRSSHRGARRIAVHHRSTHTREHRDHTRQIVKGRGAHRVHHFSRLVAVQHFV